MKLHNGFAPYEGITRICFAMRLGKEKNVAAEKLTRPNNFVFYMEDYLQATDESTVEICVEQPLEAAILDSPSGILDFVTFGIHHQRVTKREHISSLIFCTMEYQN